MIGATLSALGCASAFRPGNHLVPGPSGAISAAPLSQHRFALLAGPAGSKGVFIVDLNSGQLQRSFGVTREATGIAAETPDGPLLITVGGVGRRGKPFGAVERWSLTGNKQRVVAMPAQARSITRVEQGMAYVLVGNGSARAAIPLEVPSLRVQRPMALDAGAEGLQQCASSSSPYLLYASTAQGAPSYGGAGTIVVREIGTGMVMRSSVSASSPTCIGGHSQVFALQRTFAAASVVMLALPTLLQQGLVPASNDAISLYETDDHHLAALNSTPRTSNIEIFSDSALSVKPAAK